MSNSILMIGDAVQYIGTRFKSELTNKSGPMKGWVHSRCSNQPEMVVVEFLDCKDPDFIIHESNLKKWTDKTSHSPYEVAPRRKKIEEEVK